MNPAQLACEVELARQQVRELVAVGRTPTQVERRRVFEAERQLEAVLADDHPRPNQRKGSLLTGHRYRDDIREGNAAARSAVRDPLAEPGRVAFAGDWHMDAVWAVQAIQHAAAERAEVIVHLGDFGWTFDPRFVERVHEALHAVDLVLLFVDGNHEDHDRLLAYPVADNGLRPVTDRIWHLPRGFRWTWHGQRWLALGGAHSVDRPRRTLGVSWWPQETITTGQALETMADGPADILVAHDCPAGVTIPGIDDRTGPPPFPASEIRRTDEHRHLLRAVVDRVQPRWIFHGHYHVAYSTTVGFGYGPVTVTGLDRDGSDLHLNVAVRDAAPVTCGDGDRR